MSNTIFVGLIVLLSVGTLSGFGVTMIGKSYTKAATCTLHSSPIRLVRTILRQDHVSKAEHCEDCVRSSNSSNKEIGQMQNDVTFSTSEAYQATVPLKIDSPRVTIEYCTGCRWLLRAGWTAQELLTTFEKEISEVAIRPGRVTGVFNVWVDSNLVWNRTEIRRFPEMKELKQRIRDVVSPNRNLGHSDK